jgi:hypothetical protein
MRIGTWNLDGRRGARQRDFLRDQECDVLLLTEVPCDWELPDYHLSPGGPDMGPCKRWAAIASRVPLVPIDPPPHPATAAVVVDGTTYVSSILPWRGSGGKEPWLGADHAERVTNTLEPLGRFLRKHANLVWGGDWNHALDGPERAGSMRGRADLVKLLDELGLAVPTEQLGHREDGLFSIDHIATRRVVHGMWRVVAADDRGRLSDHDFYAVET